MYRFRKWKNIKYKISLLNKYAENYQIDLLFLLHFLFLYFSVGSERINFPTAPILVTFQLNKLSIFLLTDRVC